MYVRVAEIIGSSIFNQFKMIMAFIENQFFLKILKLVN